MDNFNQHLIDRDLKHVWHPCSQMKDYEKFPPLVIQRAQGAYFYLEDERAIIDAISSWWCKSLGHNHPRIKAAVLAQMEKFEHVILANTTHELVINLSEKLAQLLPPLDKVLYASDGACAVEMALKMALHAQQLRGQPHKSLFMALENSYHGDTTLALSVSDLGLFRKPYEPVLSQAEFIRNIPYVSSKTDPLWHDCSSKWDAIAVQLNQHQHKLCAIIVEPILQGTAGMRIYSQDFLRRLSLWCKQHGVYLIADEIFTGIGRTGLPLACQHAGITPDFLCLGKSLTAGFLPLSAMLTTTDIYALFYDDYEKGKTFIHSHTHTGNALALAAAFATLTIMEEENIYPAIQQLEIHLVEHMQSVLNETQQLKNLRHIGAVVAADLIIPAHYSGQRLGFEVYQQAVNLGALLRPLGNTLYWAPPYNIEGETLLALQQITSEAINIGTGRK